MAVTFHHYRIFIKFTYLIRIIEKMYSLVQDESECKSVLGTMIYTERKIFGFSPKVVDAIVPGSMFGHVEYKMEIKAVPHNSIDNEPRIFTFITRFKEVSNLHKTLGSIHRNLYLKDKFPPFAKAQYFGTASPETITERRNHIEAFLQFVFNNETLCKSKAFQAYLESTKEELKTESAAESTKVPESAEQLDQFSLAENTSPCQNTTACDDLLTMGNVLEEKVEREEELKK